MNLVIVVKISLVKVFFFIEVTETQPNDNRPPISKGVYPTGRHVVVKREAVNVEGDKFLMIDKEFKTMFRID